MWAPYVDGQSSPRPEHDRYRKDGSRHDIEQVVVGGGYDGHEGKGRVRHSKDASGAMARDEQDLERHPGCPGDVQRRHCGVEIGRHGGHLVGDIAHDGRVNETRPRDQSWRCDREHPEDDERDRVDADKGIARRAVGDRVAPVDPEEHDKGH